MWFCESLRKLSVRCTQVPDVAGYPRPLTTRRRSRCFENFANVCEAAWKPRGVFIRLFEYSYGVHSSSLQKHFVILFRHSALSSNLRFDTRTVWQQHNRPALLADVMPESHGPVRLNLVILSPVSNNGEYQTKFERVQPFSRCLLQHSAGATIRRHHGASEKKSSAITVNQLGQPLGA